MKNRRNFYRILHVQPEAPQEIIKASYRSLMTKLKAHPDLGGDHDTAVLINQAYAVLGDPEQRRRYDAELRRASGVPPVPPTAARRPASSAATRAYQRHAARPGGRASGLVCVFCESEAVAPADRTAARCAFCACPLVAVGATPAPRQLEVFGRRAAPRIAKTGALMLYPSWPHPGHRAQLRDLSLTGISVFSDFAPRTHQVLKLDSPLLCGVARVTSVRAMGGRYAIHGPLLVAEFATQSGGFVSARV